MRRLWFLLAVAAATTGAGSATTVPGERLTIPYLSGGAGVYLDDDGRPITSEGAPRVPGEAVRAARVGEALREERQHGVDRVLPHRRRRRVIEVHQPFHGGER